MVNEDLVKLALKTLSCNQKELASRLGVSPTQITKWKKDEHMSLEMESKLRQILNIGDKDPSFILLAGSLHEANKWERLIHLLAEIAEEETETGYETDPLIDELDLLVSDTFNILRMMGVDLPPKFPDELEKILTYYFADDLGDDLGDDPGDEISDEFLHVIDANPYSSLIFNIFKSFTDVYGFYLAYISELIDDWEDTLLDSPAGNIEPCLMQLAASKVEVNEKLAPNFKNFSYKVMNDYEEWITFLKDYAFHAGMPLRAELMDIVYGPHDKLGHDAGAECLGLNTRRLHPDIYMNELLCGMRAIHQILPAIMEKLGIHDDFDFDTSDFNIG